MALVIHVLNLAIVVVQEEIHTANITLPSMFKNAILPAILRIHFLDFGIESFFNKLIPGFRPMEINQFHTEPIEKGMCFRKALNQETKETYFDVRVLRVIERHPTKFSRIVFTGNLEGTDTYGFYETYLDSIQFFDLFLGVTL